VKIKVAPGWDARPVEAARRALAGRGIPLTVDANGGYEWPAHEAALRGLDDAGLLYIEQPLAPDDLLGHARLSQTLRTPVCVDETLHGERAARQLLDLDGPRVWNVKVHRMGGLSEVCRVVRLGRDRGVRLWGGTMPESGLGSQAALAAAALPGFVFPSDLEPSTRWFGPGVDVIDLRMAADGTMEVPTSAVAERLDQSLFRRATRRLD
jgi:O-succinylbenzoate synthase